MSQEVNKSVQESDELVGTEDNNVFGQEIPLEPLTPADFDDDELIQEGDELEPEEVEDVARMY
jgi:hypothetical protein